MKLNETELELIFIRHGQSYGNVKFDSEVTYHPDDPPLTPLGHMQAQLIADRLSEIRIDAIFASPLTRTIETIYPTAKKKNLPITLLPDLLEVETTIGGCAPEIIETDFPLAVQCRTEPSPAGGKLLLGDETPEMMQLRGKRCVDFIRSNFSNGERVIVVSHGGFCGYFIRSALGIGLDESFTWKVDNAGMTGVIFRKGRLPWLSMANERSHLYNLNLY